MNSGCTPATSDLLIDALMRHSPLPAHCILDAMKPESNVDWSALTRIGPQCANDPELLDRLLGLGEHILGAAYKTLPYVIAWAPVEVLEALVR